MTRMQMRLGALGLTVVAFATVLIVGSPRPPESDAQEQPKPAGRPVVMPGQLTGVLITFGLKDQKNTTWEGEISLSQGKIVSLAVVESGPAGSVDGARFSVGSAFFPKKIEKKKPGAIIRPSVRVTVDAPPSARVTVTTKQGKFDFVIGDLPEAARRLYLDGQASAQREEGSIRLTGGDTENDYPALAKAADGTLWLAYSEYRKGKPYVAERVLAGNFDDLVPQGHGDQVKLKKFDGKEWSAPIDVTEPGLDIWRPTVAVVENQVHVSWAQQVNGNWDIYHRVYAAPVKEGDQGRWSKAFRVTDDPGTDFNVVAAASTQRQVWIAWQSWQAGRFVIQGRAIQYDGGDKIAYPRRFLEKGPRGGNCWNPAIACDSRGVPRVAFDTYSDGSYDVVIGGSEFPRVVAKSAHFEARPSIVFDDQGRLWIAYEDGDEQWGKDYSTNMFRKIGFDENPGNALYINRTVRVKCLLPDSKLMQPAGDLQKALGQRTANNKSLPRLGVDGGGSVWLLYRHHPKPLGAGEVWNSFATRHDGNGWSEPRRLSNSDNLMDNRPALAPLGSGLLAVYSGDGRTKQQDRKRNDLYAALLTGSGPKQAAALQPDVPSAGPAMKPVHPNEAADVARIRDYRLEHEGKKLRLFRGEFHRHTEYTAHRDQDGLLEDSWRYALDAGNLDWMGNADHDNGHHDEYSWWQIQKTADLMHNPSHFVAVQSYERSVVYPNGHRNVIMPKRGIRPLPRGDLKGTEEKGTPDTKILYKYLKHFGAMCSSHTSGTGMGTDWRDNDPVVEPVVEVYQGHRHNYEHFGAPRSATKDTQIGGYEPKGFIWNALDKGYKLGFQASSDHVSTHMSYAIVLTDDLSRQGIIDAFKRRHSYAATDNIIVEFRCGKHIMGDIFETKQRPTFAIKVLGTAPVTKVSIVRNGKYIHVEEPQKQDVSIAFTDMEPVEGKAAYYYVRVEQRDANLAWASPMWMTYRP